MEYLSLSRRMLVGGLFALTACDPRPRLIGQICVPPPDDANMVRRVAGASVIIIATPDMTPDQLREMGRGGDDSIALSLRIVEWLKGDGDTQSIDVTASLTPDQTVSDFDPSIKRLYFLHPVAFGPGLQVTGPAMDPLTAPAVSSEMARQNLVLANWTPNTALPHYAEVKNLIGSLVQPLAEKDGGERQTNIYDQLIALPIDAVPSIVVQLDDRRPLPDNVLLIKPLDPTWFERPVIAVEQVVDLLNQALIYKTHEFFGDTGTTPSDRGHIVSAWKVYASAKLCHDPWPAPEIDMVLAKRRTRP